MIISNNKINKSPILIKKIEIPYLLNEKNNNLQSYNGINIKEISKGAPIFGKIKMNNSKKIINHRRRAQSFLS